MSSSGVHDEIGMELMRRFRDHLESLGSAGFKVSKGNNLMTIFKELNSQLENPRRQLKDLTAAANIYDAGIECRFERRRGKKKVYFLRTADPMENLMRSVGHSEPKKPHKAKMPEHTPPVRSTSKRSRKIRKAAAPDDVEAEEFPFTPQKFDISEFTTPKAAERLGVSAGSATQPGETEKFDISEFTTPKAAERLGVSAGSATQPGETETSMAPQDMAPPSSPGADEDEDMDDWSEEEEDAFQAKLWEEVPKSHLKLRDAINDFNILGALLTASGGAVMDDVACVLKRGHMLILICDSHAPAEAAPKIPGVTVDLLFLRKVNPNLKLFEACIPSSSGEVAYSVMEAFDRMYPDAATQYILSQSIPRIRPHVPPSPAELSAAAPAYTPERIRPHVPPSPAAPAYMPSTPSEGSAIRSLTHRQVLQSPSVRAIVQQQTSMDKLLQFGFSSRPPFANDLPGAVTRHFTRAHLQFIHQAGGI